MMNKQARAFFLGWAAALIGIGLSIVLLKFALLVPIVIRIQPWGKP